MSDNSDIRGELMARLTAYLKGSQSLQDVLAWEAGYSLAPDISRPLRIDLDRLALIGEEVESGYREEAEFRELAQSLVSGAGSAARAS